MTFEATFGRPFSPTFQPLSGGKDVAKFYCTTTGGETLTISALTVSAQVTVDWGDGSTNDYTGSGTRTHIYSGAGTFTIKISNPLNITALTLSDNKVTLNSADIAGMLNITSARFYLLKAGTFDSADVSAWRPTTFYLYSMPTGYAGTFDSADVSAWRPTTFYLNSMPTGYAGTFDSADVSAWRPTTFYLNSMPTGYAGTFDSADVSAWRPTTFYLYSMPATFEIITTANGFASWNTPSNFQLNNNALTQAQVDQILADFWSAFATRTVTGGTLNVGGNNAAPSGTLQAANPPTTGKEYAYELKNDSQNINPTKKWTTVTITA
jgi:hypothetical protein